MMQSSFGPALRPFAFLQLLAMVGVVVVCHLSAVVSGSKGVRGASVMWCMPRGQEVPTMWVSHSLGLSASLVALLYLNDTPHIRFDGEEGAGASICGSGLSHLCPSLPVDWNLENKRNQLVS